MRIPKSVTEELSSPRKFNFFLASFTMFLGEGNLVLNIEEIFFSDPDSFPQGEQNCHGKEDLRRLHESEWSLNLNKNPSRIRLSIYKDQRCNGALLEMRGLSRACRSPLGGEKMAAQKASAVGVMGKCRFLWLLFVHQPNCTPSKAQRKLWLRSLC